MKGKQRIDKFESLIRKAQRAYKAERREYMADIKPRTRHQKSLEVIDEIAGRFGREISDAGLISLALASLDLATESPDGADLLYDNPTACDLIRLNLMDAIHNRLEDYEIELAE